MSEASSGACLGHHLRHVWDIIWACLGQHLGHIFNNGQQSAVPHASAMPFLALLSQHFLLSFQEQAQKSHRRDTKIFSNPEEELVHDKESSLYALGPIWWSGLLKGKIMGEMKKKWTELAMLGRLLKRQPGTSHRGD